MKKRWWLAIVAVPLVGGGIWLHHSHAAKVDAPTETKMVAADRGAVKQVVVASGRIAANNEVDIKCKASGAVTTLPFDASDVVKKGELVMQLDPEDEKRQVAANAAAMEAAQCRVTAAQKTLEIAEQTYITDTHQAESALAAAEVTAKETREKARRTAELFAHNLESAEIKETDEATAERAELAVADAHNAIEALKTRPIQIDMDRNQVTLAEIDVKTAAVALSIAQQALTDTNVFSPIDGVVTTRPAQIGTIVASGVTNFGGGTSVMTLCDLSRLFVLAPVDEADIGKVQKNQKVTISCDAFPDKKFDGIIVRIAAKGSNLQNVVSFEVKIEVLGEGIQLLKPEMSTDVEIVVAERENVLRVPSEAVHKREKEKTRYVLVPKNASTTQPATAPAATAPATDKPGSPPSKVATAERDVQIGVDDGTFCEILGGLKEGEKVAVESDGRGQWEKRQAGNSDDE